MSTLPGMLAEWALKSAVLLLVAAMLALLLRKRSPAARHLVWTSALAGALLLPLVGTLAPRWQLGFLSPPDVPAATSGPIALPNASSLAALARDVAALEQQRPVLGPRRAESSVGTLGGKVVDADHAPPRLSNAFLLVALWGAGVAAVLVALLVGHAAVHSLAARAKPVSDDRLLRAARDASRQLGITREVRILCGAGSQMPATWGIFRPTIVLPEAAASWTDEEQRVVLLHELSHVRRFDALTQLVAQLACAIYWFNPLVWYGARRMREERERACDAAVLGGGADACSYAQHLLHVARSHRSPRRAALAALSMARPSQLEGRLVAILDAAPARELSRRGTATLGGLLLSSVFALAALSPWREPATANSTPLPSIVEAPQSAPDAPATPEVVDTVRMTFPMRAGQWLEVLTVWGTITAVPASGDVAEVIAVKKAQDGGRAAIDRIEITEGRNDAGVKVCARWPNGGGMTPCEVRGRGQYDAMDAVVSFTVRVPKGVKLEAHTIMGNVVATGLDAYVWATSTMGNLAFSTSAFGEGSTSAGNITASMGATNWGDNMELETGAGHVVVEVPRDVRTKVEGEADRGAIGSDFALKFKDVNDTGWLTGTLGDGGNGYLTMRSKKGNVFLRRASGRQSLDMRSLDSLAAIGTPGIRGAVVPVQPGNPWSKIATASATPTPTATVLDGEPAGGENPSELDLPYRVDWGGVTGERVKLDVPGNFLRGFTPALLKGKRDSVAIVHLLPHAKARWIAYQNGAKDPGVELVGDRAIWALTRVRNGSEIHEGLFDALEDPDWRIRAYAAWAIAEVGEWATGPVYAALRDPEWRVRMHAAVAMGNFRAKASVRLLIPMLDDEHYQVRSAAAAALGEIGDRGALPALREAVGDPHAMVRAEAESAVAKLGGQAGR